MSIVVCCTIIFNNLIIANSFHFALRINVRLPINKEQLYKRTMITRISLTFHPLLFMLSRRRQDKMTGQPEGVSSHCEETVPSFSADAEEQEEEPSVGILFIRCWHLSCPFPDDSNCFDHRQTYRWLRKLRQYQ